MNLELYSDSIYGCFKETAERNAHNIAIIYLGEKYSFADLKDMVRKLAASLSSLGIQEDSRVILYLYNLPQTIIGFLALQRLGAIAIPVAPVYSAADLKYMANDCHAETIFCMDSNFNYVNEILPDTSLNQIVVTNMVDLIPWWKRVVARGFDRVPGGVFPSGKRIHAFVDLLKNGQPASLPEFKAPGPDKTSLILYTGGTTGFPKGVPLSIGIYLYKTLEWRKASLALISHG
ncbi:MAG: class I adenylate-forming enzyme family protein, partial [Desulfobacterales bacterium]